MNKWNVIAKLYRGKREAFFTGAYPAWSNHADRAKRFTSKALATYYARGFGRHTFVMTLSQKSEENWRVTIEGATARDALTAIIESTTTSMMVTLPWSQAAEDKLLLEALEDMEVDDGDAYWGTLDEKDWLVHLRKPPL